ncbi:hypothetical protein [Aureimonas sp. N4]|uniref:hypothetical protein n=1 Tax=Aureimonas sp. N4 TaxID=1638165 RepID=UPI000781580A|nr:hypothetical protein [Aureimonas sp. N4]
MSDRYALITNGVVSNSIVADADFAKVQGLVLLPAGAGIGWLYDGKTFSAPPVPPEPVPSAVTMRQARIALSRAGLLSKAEAAIAQMAGQAGEEARIEWEYAAELKRNHPLIAALGQALGLSAEAIDDLFREAATI